MAVRKKLTKRQKRGKKLSIIVKANELVEAKYLFDIWEMRVFLSLVSLIQPSDGEDRVYRLWYRDIKKSFQIKSHKSYQLLRDAAIRLFDKSVVVGYMKNGYPREVRHHLIRAVDYAKDVIREDGIKGVYSEQEYIDVKIDQEIKPYLLDIRKRFDPQTDQYTRYELRNVIHLQPYGIRMYELLKQYEKIGQRTLEVQQLKDCFNITDEYPRFANFYQKVIKKSIEDINANTDISVPISEIQKIKRGRSVYALRFPIYRKSPKQLAKLRGEPIQPPLPLFSAEAEEREAEVAEVMEQEQSQADVLFAQFEDIVVKQFGVTPTAFVRLLEKEQYQQEYIEQAIEVTRRAKYKQEIKKSVPGFFIKALQESYTDPKVEAAKKKKKKAEDGLVVQQALENYQAEMSAKINDIIKTLTAEDSSITEQAIAAMKENAFIQKYIGVKEQELGRGLELEDYRLDKKLRAMVIKAIVNQNREHFQEVLEEYEPKIKALEAKLQAL